MAAPRPSRPKRVSSSRTSAAGKKLAKSSSINKPCGRCRPRIRRSGTCQADETPPCAARAFGHPELSHSGPEHGNVGAHQSLAETRDPVALPILCYQRVVVFDRKGLARLASTPQALRCSPWRPMPCPPPLPPLLRWSRTLRPSWRDDAVLEVVSVDVALPALSLLAEWGAPSATGAGARAVLIAFGIRRRLRLLN